MGEEALDLAADAVMLAADEIAHLAEQIGAADDSVRIHWDVTIALWSLRRVHACCPFLEFLNGIRMLAPCFRGDKNLEAAAQLRMLPVRRRSRVPQPGRIPVAMPRPILATG